MTKYFKLLRVNQWYKNLVIFIPLFFSINIFVPEVLLTSILGFLALSLVSSSYYIINDIRDLENDRKHPEKKHRAIASGRISVRAALSISFILLACSLGLSYYLNPLFAVFPAVLFIVTMVYTFWLKDIAILDIHVISLNFLVRTVSGSILISVPVSDWLVITIFLMAMVLASSKRRSELVLLGKKAAEHRKVYEVYTVKLLDMILMISITMLLISYSLYTFIAHPQTYMIFTLPVVTFIIFRYVTVLLSGSRGGRSTEFMISDRQTVAGVALWALLVFLNLYLL